ncbi:hypothetical protein Tco_0281488 [Tanacetum coccineum]
MYPRTTSESSPGDSSFESSVGPSHKRCRSRAATVTSSIYATRALVPSCADLLPPSKRFRDFIPPEDSVEEDIDKNVLEDIEAVLRLVNVEDEVEDKVESSDRGTMEVGVDVVAEIDFLDRMLIPDNVKRLEQVKEDLQDVYEHVMEIPLQRIEDIEMGQRDLEEMSLIAGGERASLLEQVMSLERSNARLRGTMMMERARADRLSVEPVDSSSISVNQVPHYGLNRNTKSKSSVKLMAEVFQELTMMCTKMVLEEEDRVEKFIGGLPDNIQGNVIAAEPTRLQDACIKLQKT